MMMPVLDPNPAPQFHGHSHHVLYHQQHIPEQTGKMLVTLILPNGVPSVISVEANTPMMDLLVQAASLNKLNPSSHALVVLDSNQHVIHFKPSQTVGQIVQNCQLPQINGSSTISLLPKDTPHAHPLSKTKPQPFEITVRLLVNLPDGQKIILRVDPTLPLHEIKEQICKQKKYIDSGRYTLRLPQKLDRPLLLGLSLAEYKTNELTLIHLKQDRTSNRNQLQSFDRLYRIRSESQPPNEPTQEVHNEQQGVANNKQRPASVQLNPTTSPTRGQQVTSALTRVTRPVTSHTSLHAYWNDPNFDTQSQTSNCSSTTKKRRAPKPPDQMSPTSNDQENALSPSADHHQSHESLTESINGTKNKRKAPTPPATGTSPDTQVNEAGDEQPTTNVETQKVTIQMHSDDEQRLSNIVTDEKLSPNTKLVVTTKMTEEYVTESHSPVPIYSQIEKVKESTQVESPYSTVQCSPSPPISQHDEPASCASPAVHSVENIVQAGIAEPPSRSRESTPMEGISKIINFHKERDETYQKSSSQPTEGTSYYRVAKSRNGKFETDDKSFVHNTANVFDSTHTNQEQPTTEKISSMNEIRNATTTSDREKSPVPIQLEVTERTTHISVTVESDRKQFITRASPVPQQAPGSPPPVAPKPSGKTITEYRTVRRIGHDGETTTTTTVRTETIPPTSPDQKQTTSSDNVDQTNIDSETQQESTQPIDSSKTSN